MADVLLSFIGLDLKDLLLMGVRKFVLFLGKKNLFLWVKQDDMHTPINMEASVVGVLITWFPILVSLQHI